MGVIYFGVYLFEYITIVFHLFPLLRIRLIFRLVIRLGETLGDTEIGWEQ